MRYHDSSDIVFTAEQAARIAISQVREQLELFVERWDGGMSFEEALESVFGKDEE